MTGARSVVSDTKACRWSGTARLEDKLFFTGSELLPRYSLDSTSSDPTYPNSGRVKRKGGGVVSGKLLAIGRWKASVSMVEGY